MSTLYEEYSGNNKKKSLKITRNYLSKEIELFQNKVLRPILKFQNNLLLHIFNDYINQFKGEFFKLSSQQKLSYIQDIYYINVT